MRGLALKAAQSDSAKMLTFFVVILVLGFTFGVFAGAYLSETVIIRECNTQGEYSAAFGDAYIVCNMED